MSLIKLYLNVLNIIFFGDGEMNFKLKYSKICNNLNQIFKLDFSKDDHNIICVGFDDFSRKIEYAFVQGFSADVIKSEEIFNKIVKYEAISCTVCEIVEDLIC